MKQTKMQRQLAETDRRRLNAARRELAKRIPEERDEIMAGEYDSGMGMREVLEDMKRLGP
jgi:hypothetical protein